METKFKLVSSLGVGDKAQNLTECSIKCCSVHFYNFYMSVMNKM